MHSLSFLNPRSTDLQFGDLGNGIDGGVGQQIGRTVGKVEGLEQGPFAPAELAHMEDGGAGVGIAFIPDQCVQQRPDIRFIPMNTWHQALYMWIYYDKWLEPPVWDFVELLVRSLRESSAEGF